MFHELLIVLCALFPALLFDITKMFLASTDRTPGSDFSVLHNGNGRNPCGLQSFFATIYIYIYLWSELLMTYCSVQEKKERGKKEKEKREKNLSPHEKVRSVGLTPITLFLTHNAW